MHKNTSEKLLLSIFALSLSIISGWLLTWKLAGAAAGYRSLSLCLTLAVATLACQCCFYIHARQQLRYAILFTAAFGLNLACFTLSLFIPIYWIDSVPQSAKWLATVTLVLLCALNIIRGRQMFQGDWALLSDPLKIGNFNREKHTVDWERIQENLNTRFALYIPGISENLAPIISALLVFSMLAGLSFRSAYPTFSSFAWGIPSAILTSLIFQIIGYRLAEANKIGELQKELNLVFITI